MKVLLAILFLLTSCRAIERISESSLNHVGSATSNTIFKETNDLQNKTVFIQITNTANIDNFDSIKYEVEQKLKSKGYKITSNPNEKKATIIQANIRYYGFLSEEDVKKTIGLSTSTIQEKKIDEETADYTTAAAFGVTSFVIFNTLDAALLGGLGGIGASKAMESLFKIHRFGAIIDIQIANQTNAKISQKDFREYRQDSGGIRKVESYSQTNIQSLRTTNIVSVQATKFSTQNKETKIAIQKNISTSIAEMI